MGIVDHRAQHVRDGKKPRTDAEKKYSKWLKDGAVSLECRIAFETYETFGKRVKVDSLIIGGCPDDVFVDVLNFPKKSVELYRELFFDLGALHTGIDKLDFAENYYKEVAGTTVPPVDNLVLRGLNQGYQLLLLQFCNLVPTKAESVEILKRVFAAAVFKATSVQFTGMGSAIDKRAIEHSQLALKLIDMMNALKSESDEVSATSIKFVSILKDSGSLPKNFDPSNII